MPKIRIYVEGEVKFEGDVTQTELLTEFNKIKADPQYKNKTGLTEYSLTQFYPRYNGWMRKHLNLE